MQLHPSPRASLLDARTVGAALQHSKTQHRVNAALDVVVEVGELRAHGIDRRRDPRRVMYGDEALHAASLGLGGRYRYEVMRHADAGGHPWKSPPGVRH